MLYVRNLNELTFGRVTENVDNVLLKSYKTGKFDSKPLFTLFIKRQFSCTVLDDTYVRCNASFKAFHKETDPYEYNLYLSKLDESERLLVSDCILAEVDDSSDTYLLITQHVPGAMFSMTNEWRYDVYAGSYLRNNRYGFLMKVNESFKLQEYFFNGKNAIVTDRMFNYNHVKGTLDYSSEDYVMDKSFYFSNKDLFDGKPRSRYEQWELFFVRDSLNYPR